MRSRYYTMYTKRYELNCQWSIILTAIVVCFFLIFPVFAESSDANLDFEVYSLLGKTNYGVDMSVINDLAKKNTANAPVKVWFTSNRYYTNLPTPSPILWKFGDGETSTECYPQHEYKKAGIYTVSLTHTQDNIPTTKTKENLITVLPFAKYSTEENPIWGHAPYTVHYRDWSQGEPDTYLWEFEDGATSTEKNPVHTYKKAGYPKPPKLTVSKSGLSDTTATLGSPGFDTGWWPETNIVVLPTSDFTASVTSGAPPLKVSFTSNAKGEPETYTWNFGDMSPESSEKNPTHIFEKPGTYIAGLTVSTKAGERESDLLKDYKMVTINVGGDSSDGNNNNNNDNNNNPEYDYFVLPKADLTKSPEVHFSDSSYCSESTVIPTKWSWNLGDGTSSDKKDFTHTYQQPGTYTVTVTVTFSDGISDTGNATIEIKGSGPIIEPEYDYYVLPKADIANSPDIHFSDSSYCSESTVVPTKWSWKLGDGSTSDQKDFTHTYQQPGTYTVTVTVTFSDGISDTGTATIEIKGSECTKNCTAQGTNSAGEFTGSAIGESTCDEVGGITWDFGDGSTTVAQNNQPVHHSYSKPGAFQPKVILHWKTAGNEYCGCIIDPVVVTGPDIVYSPKMIANPETGKVPLTVTFTDSSSATGGVTASSWSWKLSDGFTSTERTFSHEFTKEGTFHWTGTVTYSDGVKKTLEGDIQVTAAECTYSCNAQGSSIEIEGSARTFTGKAGGESPCDEVTKIIWDFGDGSTATAVNNEEVTHTYQKEGTFKPTVKIVWKKVGELECGGAIDTVVVKPQNIVHTTSMTADPKSGIAPLTVSFTDSSTATGGVTISSRSWKLSDGFTSQDKVVQHQFMTAGTYHWTGTVTYSDGFTETREGDITVTEQCRYVCEAKGETIASGGPIQRFSGKASASSGCDKLNSITWDFGDGSSALVQNNEAVTHEYTTPGTFQPRIILSWSSAGDQFCDCVISPVNVSSGPEYKNETKYKLDAVATPGEGFAPWTITFKDQSWATNGVTPVKWNWDLGDGSTENSMTFSHTYVKAGVYTVPLKVTFSDGIELVDTNTIRILEPTRYYPAMIPTPSSGQSPLDVTFTDSSTATNGVIPIAWVWDLGNGIKSTERECASTYPNAGSYHWTAGVVYSDGHVERAEGIIEVKGPTPEHWAELVPDPVIGIAPLKVEFSDRSSATEGVTVSKTKTVLGDGTVIEDQKLFSHTYEEAGEYEVKHTVKFSDGEEQEVSGVITVYEQTKYVVQNTVTPEVGIAPLMITGEDFSYATNGIYPTAFEWNMGDGSGESGSIINHTYLEPGKYTVLETVTFSDNTSKTSNPQTVIVDAVTPPKPQVQYHLLNEISPLIGKAPLEVRFIDKSYTNREDITVTAWKWEITNETTSSEKEFNRTLDKPGKYQVIETVTFSDGNQSVSSPVIIQVKRRGTINTTFIITGTPGNQNQGPGNETEYFLDATASPGKGFAPMTLSFIDLSWATNGVKAVGWNWDLGDGSTENNQTFFHTYVNPGEYTVPLKVRFSDGVELVDTNTITIMEPTHYSPSMTATPGSGAAPLEVTFSDRSTANNGIIPVAWAWDTGDGTVSTDQEFTFTYLNKGTYHWTGGVVYSDGHTEQQEGEITVTAPPEPIDHWAELYPKPDSGVAPLTVEFSDRSSATTGVTIRALKTDLGDGTLIEDQKNFTHMYQEPGDYNVKHKVTFSDGVEREVSGQITVYEPTSYIVQGIVTPKRGVVPLVVSGEDSSYGTNGVYVMSSEWEMGDGTKEFGRTIRHTYEKTGEFQVTQTVTYSDGYTQAGNPQTVTVGEVLPEPPATPKYYLVNSISPLTGKAPLQVNLTDSSYTDTPGITAKSWEWKINNETTSSEKAFTKNFESPGAYQVVETVTFSDNHQEKNSPVTIQVKRKGKITVTFTVTGNDQTTTTTTQDKKVGSLLITSTPSGARIFIGGLEIPGVKTPGKINNVPTGTYEMYASLDGIKSEKRSVTIQPDQITDIKFIIPSAVQDGNDQDSSMNPTVISLPPDISEKISNNRGETPGSTSNEVKAESITLKRGMCYGTCPVYSVTIRSDGTVQYVGEKYVKEIGPKDSSITSEEFTSLKATIESSGFFTFNDAYRKVDMTDMPSATITVTIGDKTKQIEHYHGDSTAPQQLTDLEDAIDRTVSISQWTEPYEGPMRE